MITLRDLLADTGGVAVGLDGGHRFELASADSRQCPPGALFAAVRGDHLDGHRFAQAALEQGAGAVLVDEPGGWSPRIEVPDVRRALFQILAGQRRRYGGQVVAVTGSVGKTTTKDLLAQLMAPYRRTFRSPGNLNSNVGLPLAAVSLSADDQLAVVEMAMRLPGEIHELALACPPDLAIVTRIGVSHIGRLGSVEAIARAKGELFGALSGRGVAILNADDPWSDYLALLAPGRALRAGQAEGADLRLEVREDKGLAGWSVTLRGAGQSVAAEFSWPGTGALEALALAAQAALALGLSLTEIAAAVSHLDPAASRLVIWEAHGVLVLDDAYNASPQSVAAALRLLGSVKGRRRVAILGEMRELGAHSRELHLEVGRMAGLAVDQLVCVGEGGQEIAAGARAAGLADRSIHLTSDRRMAAALSRRLLEPGDAVLVKASRAVGLDGLLREVLGDG